MRPFGELKNNVTAVHCRLVEGTSDIEVWAVRNASSEAMTSISKNLTITGSDLTLEYLKIRDGRVVENQSYPIADKCATQIEVTKRAIIIGCPSF